MVSLVILINILYFVSDVSSRNELDFLKADILKYAIKSHEQSEVKNETAVEILQFITGTSTDGVTEEEWINAQDIIDEDTNILKPYNRKQLQKIIGIRQFENDLDSYGDNYDVLDDYSNFIEDFSEGITDTFQSYFDDYPGVSDNNIYDENSNVIIDEDLNENIDGININYEFGDYSEVVGDEVPESCDDEDVESDWTVTDSVNFVMTAENYNDDSEVQDEN